MDETLSHLLLVAAGIVMVLPVAWAIARVRAAERRTHEATRLAHESLHEALEGSMLAVFDWDVAANEVRLSPSWAAILGGRPAETRSTPEELMTLVHPDDVDRVRIAIFDVLKGHGPRYDFEHRVRKHDGSYLWIHSRGKVTARDPDGRALRFSGTNADITARRTAERRLAERESQLRQVIDAVPAAIAFVSPEERIVFHNRQYAEWLPVSPEPLNGRLVRDLVGEEFYETISGHLRRALAGATSRFEQEVPGPDARPMDLEVVYTPLFDPEGAVSGTIVLRIDITRLKDLDRMKDRFIAIASHELRTPLTAMRGSLGLLQGGVEGELSAEARSMVDIALHNCERLVRLVNDLLDLEKMALGQVTYRNEDLDWDSVLEQAIDSSRGFVESFGVRFEHLHCGGLRVRGDSDRLIQVLSNLLFNAAKFSPEGSVVTVSAERHGEGWIRTSVRDRGIGIAEDFRAHVFERFAQAETGDARRREGTGLGLAISREIVEQLGGRIGFDAAQGGGTVFWFDVPESSLPP